MLQTQKMRQSPEGLSRLLGVLTSLGDLRGPFTTAVCPAVLWLIQARMSYISDMSSLLCVARGHCSIKSPPTCGWPLTPVAGESESCSEHLEGACFWSTYEHVFTLLWHLRLWVVVLLLSRPCIPWDPMQQGPLLPSPILSEGRLIRGASP